MNKCGNPDCGVSTGICDKLTFGWGELSDYGYWEHPCASCARAYEKEHPMEGPAWPVMSPKEFYDLCSKETFLRPLVAFTGMELLEWSNEKRIVCAGISVMSRKKLLKYGEMGDVKGWLDFMQLLDQVMEENGWNFTRFPGDVD